MSDLPGTRKTRGRARAAGVLLLVPALVAGAEFCELKSEYIEGLNRICIYSCVTGDRAITVDAASFCPPSALL